MTERRQALCGLTMLLAIGATGCDEAEPAGERVSEAAEASSAGTATFPATFARQWMTNLANSVKGDGISPPVAARTYAYGGIAVWEAVVHGIPGGQSLAGQLNGLDALPEPDPGLEYDWPTVLAWTMHRMSGVAPGPGGLPAQAGTYVYPERVFFEFTTGSQASLTALGPQQIGYRRVDGVPEQVIEDSMAYADQLANALIAWANADGYNEARYKGFIPPEGPDKWVPTGFSDADKVANPAEPGFGGLRPLVLTSPDECAPPPPVAFSTSSSSDFYAQANAVYLTDANLTDEQIEIARFWADGPGATATPAGHWMALVTKYVRSGNLADATRAYALSGIGYMDAFVAVWESKFEYNLLRPETYIRRHIDSDWTPLLPTPQFASYVSGHSGVSGASAVLLTDLFGTDPVVDNTKLLRGFGVRNYDDFFDAASEAAESRLYGGIHYPMDNSEGQTLGECVGTAVRDRVSL
jgi:membrane-associated phospholipid phosphatase